MSEVWTLLDCPGFDQCAEPISDLIRIAGGMRVWRSVIGRSSIMGTREQIYARSVGVSMEAKFGKNTKATRLVGHEQPPARAAAVLRPGRQRGMDGKYSSESGASYTKIYLLRLKHL